MCSTAAPGVDVSVRDLALGTLLEDGLPGWLHAIAGALAAATAVLPRVPEAPAARTSTCHESPMGTAPVLPPNLRQEIAIVLANLVLSRTTPSAALPNSIREGHHAHLR